jgi:hypothetical protein
MWPSKFKGMILLRDRLFDLLIHPPTGQGGFRAAQEHFVPEPDAFIHSGVDFVPRFDLVFIEPAPDSPSLQGIVQPLGKGLVGVTVADETRIINGWTLDQRCGEADEFIWYPCALQKGRHNQSP